MLCSNYACLKQGHGIHSLPLLVSDLGSEESIVSEGGEGQKEKNIIHSNRGKLYIIWRWESVIFVNSGWEKHHPGSMWYNHWTGEGCVISWENMRLENLSLIFYSYFHSYFCVTELSYWRGIGQFLWLHRTEVNYIPTRSTRGLVQQFLYHDPWHSLKFPMHLPEVEDNEYKKSWEEEAQDVGQRGHKTSLVFCWIQKRSMFEVMSTINQFGDSSGTSINWYNLETMSLEQVLVGEERPFLPFCIQTDHFGHLGLLIPKDGRIRLNIWTGLGSPHSVWILVYERKNALLKKLKINLLKW